MHTENQSDILNSVLTEAVCDLYDISSAKTQLIIYLPREWDGFGVKKVSSVYRATRNEFLVNMLNPEVIVFRNSTADLAY